MSDQDAHEARVTVDLLVTEATKRVEGLLPLETVAALDGEALLVDVREESERQLDGVIPGAVSAPRGTLEFLADPAREGDRAGFDLDRRIVLYCDSGERSVLAADILRLLGFERVAYLIGGLAAWQAEGLEVDLPTGVGPNEKREVRQ